MAVMGTTKYFISGIKVFSGRESVNPDAMKIDPDAGGDAPSVDAKTRMATAAGKGLTPTLNKALKAIKPMEVSVAVEDNGPATKTTNMPTIKTITGFEKSRLPKPAPRSSSPPTPSCAA